MNSKVTHRSYLGQARHLTLPNQGHRLELVIPGLDFDLQEGEGELLQGSLGVGFCKNTIFLVTVNHL